MAIAVDQALAKVIDENSTEGGLTVTSASFTAPANSVLLVCFYGDTNNNGGTPTVTVTNTGTSLTWNLIQIRAIGDSGATEGYAGAHYAVNASSQTITVTTTTTVINQNNQKSLVAKVYVLTGADTTTPLDTSNEGSSTTNNLTTTSITAAGNGLFFAVGNDWNARGAPTSADLTVDSYHNGSIGSATSGYKTVSAGTVNGNLDGSGGAACDWNWISFIIKEAGGAGGGLSIPVAMRNYRKRRLLV